MSKPSLLSTRFVRCTASLESSFEPTPPRFSSPGDVDGRGAELNTAVLYSICVVSVDAFPEVTPCPMVKLRAQLVLLHLIIPSSHQVWGVYSGRIQMCLWKLEEARGVFNHAAEPFCGDTVIFDLKKAHFAARFPELCDQFAFR